MNHDPTDPPLYGAIKERGRLYLEVHRELTARFGKNEARDVLSTVSRKMGLDAGGPLACHAPCGFQGVLDDFFKAPDGGVTFSTDVRQIDENRLEVQSMTCPLKDSWIEAGCSDDEVRTLLECASAYDKAVFEAAGFDLDLELWSPGRQGCCHALVTRKSPS